MSSSYKQCPQQGKFEELAAIAAVGELSALELHYFEEHVSQCPACLAAYQEFSKIAATDLGVALARRAARSEEAAAHPTPQEHAAGLAQLARLRKKLDKKPQEQSAAIRGEAATGVQGTVKRELAPDPKPRPQWFRPTAIYGIAAALVVAMVGGGFALSWHFEKEMMAQRARAHELQTLLAFEKQQQEQGSLAKTAIVRSLEESQQQRDVLQKSVENLQKSLVSMRTENAALSAQEKTAESSVAQAISRTEHLQEELAASKMDKDRLAKLQAQAQSTLNEALAELYQLRQARVESARGEPDNAETGSLVETATAAQPNAAPSEVEARDLFGARDLHIVDVSDVDGRGNNKRAFGRVYYVEKKLLVFYAFDLQDKQGVKRGVFQAWGYREANVGKPLSLGLFSVDDTVMKRWVLKESRPDVLSHIDAVFVTLEPPGGSKSPNGHKLLYANLIGPPNHP
jgi:hypothetical protein